MSLSALFALHGTLVFIVATMFHLRGQGDDESFSSFMLVVAIGLWGTAAWLVISSLLGKATP